jgi:hypothetical protein
MTLLPKLSTVPSVTITSPPTRHEKKKTFVITFQKEWGGKIRALAI